MADKMKVEEVEKPISRKKRGLETQVLQATRSAREGKEVKRKRKEGRVGKRR